MANDPDNSPDNPFESLAPPPTAQVREKVARHSSASRVWQRGMIGAGAGGLIVGMVLILVLGGFDGAMVALERIMIATGVSVGITLGGVIVVGVCALSYWPRLQALELGPGPGRREFAALFGVAAAMGAIGGVIWFALELPEPDGWFLLGGVALAILLGGTIGAGTASSAPESKGRT